MTTVREQELIDKGRYAEYLAHALQETSDLEVATLAADMAFAADEWQPYQGKKGGKGWINQRTGKIVYQAEKPSGQQPASAQPAATSQSHTLVEWSGSKWQRSENGNIWRKLNSNDFVSDKSMQSMISGGYAKLLEGDSSSAGPPASTSASRSPPGKPGLTPDSGEGVARAVFDASLLGSRLAGRGMTDLLTLKTNLEKAVPGITEKDYQDLVRYLGQNRIIEPHYINEQHLMTPAEKAASVDISGRGNKADLFAVHDRSKIGPAVASFLQTRNAVGMAFAAEEWQPYQGAGGGRGWRNSTTGEVRYQVEKPDSRGAGETLQGQQQITFQQLQPQLDQLIQVHGANTRAVLENHWKNLAEQGKSAAIPDPAVQQQMFEYAAQRTSQQGRISRMQDHQRAQAEWQQRDQQRDQRRDAIFNLHLESPMIAAAFQKVSSPPDLSRNPAELNESLAAIKSHAAGYVNDWQKAFGEKGPLAETIRASNLDEGDRQRISGVVFKGTGVLQKSVDRVQKRADSLAELQAKRNTFVETEEPDPEDEKAYDAWQRNQDKIEALDEKISDGEDNLLESQADLEDVFSSNYERLNTVLDKIQDKTLAAIDKEAETDLEPEELEEEEEPEEIEEEEPEEIEEDETAFSLETKENILPPVVPDETIDIQGTGSGAFTQQDPDARPQGEKGRGKKGAKKTAKKLTRSRKMKRGLRLRKKWLAQKKDVAFAMTNGYLEYFGTEPPGAGWISAGDMRWVKGGKAKPPSVSENRASQIAIVGGGPAGLFTAYILNQRLPEAEITIFEASARLGGKIVTDRFDDGTPFEAGVAELYEYKNPGDKDPLRSLIENDLGLATTNMSGGGVVLRGQVLRDRSDLEMAFGRETRQRVDRFHERMAELMPLKKYAQRWQPDNDHPWANKTFRECIDAELGDDEAAKEYVEAACASDLATESYTCNGLNGIKNVLLDNDEYMQLYHITGGIERLPAVLVSRIQANVRLDSSVREVIRDDSRYRVRYQSEGRDKDETFDFVFLAMPNHWLTQIKFTDPKLRESIRKFLEHYDKPAHYFRVSLLFDKPWWSRFNFPGEFWMMDCFNGCCVYDESKRWRRGRGDGHVLSFLLAGQDALLMCSANRTLDEIIECVIYALPEDWRPEAMGSLLDGQVDSFAGSINAQPGGWPAEELREEHHPESKEHPGVFIVCDCLFDSTLNAALISANTAVEILLETIDAEGSPATTAIESLASSKKGL